VRERPWARGEAIETLDERVLVPQASLSRAGAILRDGPLTCRERCGSGRWRQGGCSVAMVDRRNGSVLGSVGSTWEGMGTRGMEGGHRGR